jgi:TetR/AcrR family transcriptional regulator
MKADSMPLQAQPSSECVERIISVARDLFARYGFAHVSVGQIAAGARTSKANVFYHFRSKRDLYVVALKYAMEEFDNSLAELEARAEHPAGTFEAFVRSVALGDFSEGTSHLNSALLIRGLIDQDDDETARIVSDLSRQTFARLSGMLSRVSADEVLEKDVDVHALAILLTASDFIYKIFQPHLGDALPSPEDYSAQVVRILGHGVLAGTGGA